MEKVNSTVPVLFRTCIPLLLLGKFFALKNKGEPISLCDISFVNKEFLACKLKSVIARMDTAKYGETLRDKSTGTSR